MAVSGWFLYKGRKDTGSMKDKSAVDIFECYKKIIEQTFQFFYRESMCEDLVKIYNLEKNNVEVSEDVIQINVKGLEKECLQIGIKLEKDENFANRFDR